MDKQRYRFDRSTSFYLECLGDLGSRATSEAGDNTGHGSQVTVTLRRFDPDVDPFIWGGPESRELMKDKFITMQVFNDGDAELQDV